MIVLLPICHIAIRDICKHDTVQARVRKWQISLQYLAILA